MNAATYDFGGEEKKDLHVGTSAYKNKHSCHDRVHIST
jgi:hypothetical protein